MSAWSALFWGAFSSAALFVGQGLAGPLRNEYRITGQIMGFGAGTMISAIAYELLPESTLSRGVGIGLACAAGALVYFVADRIVDQRGGADRQSIDKVGRGSSGAAMFIGALLDGVPESFVLGITLSTGGTVSIAFVVAIFVSNIPQGVAGTTSLLQTGRTQRQVAWMWTWLTLACGVVAVLGFLLANAAQVDGLYVQAFAAGAVLTMLANSMVPEAFEHGGTTVGLYTVLGYIVAAALSIAR
jgi:ZIP family zinc transporter